MSELIIIKDEDWFRNQVIAGKVVSKCLAKSK